MHHQTDIEVEVEAVGVVWARHCTPWDITEVDTSPPEGTVGVVWITRHIEAEAPMEILIAEVCEVGGDVKKVYE